MDKAQGVGSQQDNRRDIILRVRHTHRIMGNAHVLARGACTLEFGPSYLAKISNKSEYLAAGEDKRSI